MTDQIERSYSVDTERFGAVVIIAYNIRDARERARRAFGVGPRSVTPVRAPKPPCERCDSRPCCCRAVTP